MNIFIENPDGVQKGIRFIEMNGKKLDDNWVEPKNAGEEN